MDTDIRLSPDAIQPRRPRRRAVEAPRPIDVDKVKCTVRITREAHVRLGVYALKQGLDRSEVIEDLIQNHLRRFVVQDRGKDPAPEACENASAA
jgi:hypothetical protein